MDLQELSARGWAKRAQITGAARQLFLAHGYAGTSMDAVTATAGVSKQTVYSYFPGKASLLADVIGIEIDKLAVSRGGSVSPDSLDALRTTLLQFVEGLTERLMNPDSLALFRLVFGEASRLPELRESFRGVFANRLLGQVEGVIREADARGLIRALQPELSVRMLVGPVFSFVMLDGVFLVDEIHRPTSYMLEYIVDGFLASVRVPR